MPNYTFEDTRNGELFSIELSMAEHEKFVKKNKHVKQRFDKVYVGTVSGSFDWHWEHGIEQTFKKMDHQYERATGLKPVRPRMGGK